MSLRELSPRDNPIGRAAFRIAGFVRRAVIEPAVRWQRRRATIQALSSLDDRMLSDIGVRRSEIDALARGVVLRRIEPAPILPVAAAAAVPEPLPEMKRAA